MANEQRGDLSEAVVVAALEIVGYTYEVDIFWKKTPGKLKICDSDVVLGRSIESPDAIFQICSSGYEGGYQKKFWRDSGELIDIKQNYPNTRVLSILFEPGAKDKLRQIYSFISDGTISISHLPDGPETLQMLSALEAKGTDSSRTSKLKLVKSKTSSKFLKALADELKAALSTRKATWNIPRLETTGGRAPKVNLRQGILTAALFSTDGAFGSIRNSIAAGVQGKVVPSGDHLRILYQLGVCKKSISGARIADDNLIQCARELGLEEFLRIGEKAIARNPQSRVFSYVATIQRLPDSLPVWFKAILDNKHYILSRKELKSLILKNYADHSILLPDGAPKQEEPWLFRRLLDVVRAARQLHFAIGIPRFDPHFVKAGLPALRFTISEYIAGRRPLSRTEAEVAAEVLSVELKAIKDQIAPSLFPEFVDKVTRSEYNQRLLTYRGFNAFDVLIEEKLAQNPITITPTIVKKMGIEGAATCIAVELDDSLIMWQGASADGVAHKVKEQTGRMGICCLDVEIGKNGSRHFRWSAQHTKRLLYIDGAWSDRDFARVSGVAFSQVTSIA